MSKTFEENLEALENIVNELETGNIPLEQAIEKYEEAMDLVNKCDEKLKDVAKKVKIVGENGELKNFEF